MMRVKIDLLLPSSSLETLLQDQYRLDECAVFKGAEVDEYSDSVVLSFDVDASDSKKITRNWEDETFAEGIIAEAI
jgi:hypothetical protein